MGLLTSCLGLYFYLMLYIEKHEVEMCLFSYNSFIITKLYNSM